MNMREIAAVVLEKSEKPLRSQDIWKETIRLGLDKQLNYTGKTEPHLNLYNTLNSDIKNNESSKFVKVSTNPVLFSLKTKHYSAETLDCVISSDSDNDDSETESKNTKEYNESDLHVVLAMYVNSDDHFKCRVKTIRQQEAKKRPKKHDKENVKDIYTYPDLIGVYLPFSDFDQSTAKFCQTIEKTTIKVFSFEMKISLTPSDLRESYFQAVSNSSWANEGYLAAPVISDDPDFTKELSLLNSAFGVGVIQLDVDNPADSRILFPARKKDSIDINMLDKLVCRLAVVKEFCSIIVDSVTATYITRPNFFDVVMEEDNYQEYKKKNNGIMMISGRKK